MSLYNPFSLAEKTILVTGASSGIGKAIAIECSKMGANVVITGRDKIRLLETFGLLEGGNHNMYIADLSANNGITSLTEAMEGTYDGIVYAAGINKKAPLKFVKEEQMNYVMATNSTAPLMLIQKMYRQKKICDGASIVFISSISADYASIGNIVYMASKGAVNAMVRGMALEMSKQLIRVNAIQPGMVVTDLIKNYTDAEIEADTKNYPLGRYAKPEEIAYAAVYLLSDAAKWVTGTLLKIDGGITLK